MKEEKEKGQQEGTAEGWGLEVLLGTGLGGQGPDFQKENVTKGTVSRELVELGGYIGVYRR